jgi:hypothetical protein
MSTQITTKSTAYVGARKILGDYRLVTDSVASAIATLIKVYALPEFPADFPVLVAGVGMIDLSDSDSIPPVADWDEDVRTVYETDGIQVAVSFLGVRGLKGEDGKETNGARAFVIYPIHSIDSIRANGESGESWLYKIMEKETSHVAFRGLRNVAPALGIDALSNEAKLMPLTVSDYVESSIAEGADSSAFDAIWKEFRSLLAKSAATAALAANLPGKAEVIKCIRSKGYAVENYADMESMGAFTFIADSMIKLIDYMKAQKIEAGEDVDIDSAEIKVWVSKRNEFVFAAPKKTVELDASKVDFAAFMGGIPTVGATE